MTVANIATVADRLGRPISDAGEIAQVNAWLRDVTALITSRIPDYETLLAQGAIRTDVAGMVEANAVIRKLRNPDGKQSEQIDDYSYRLNRDFSRGEIFLTDQEWELLTPFEERQQGAFSIRTHPLRPAAGQWIDSTTWVPAP
ncbi:Gp19/Gp15/Gp42 family protein [Actinobaculum massiliense]|uniref:Gp19/Gp15/Gp42 family protein n=1 Tax=Actinobaculum massiliense TaxID=202789 RepID=UPI0018D26632|nr:Gp19/Gp15/Gp42 family protein [Actinobaculum massiliense]